MKYLRLFISLCALSACAVHAQDEKQGPPGTEIPDFSNLDEYIYVPKSTLRIGTRFVSGPKSSFSGKGRISTGEDSGNATGVQARAYHDGGVNLDSRTTLVDNGDGTTSSVPVPSDGKTNSWFYNNSSQVTADGLITFHTYSAEITDTTTRTKDLSSTVGTEVLVSYDMGKIGKHLEWSIIAGVSLNDLSAKLSGKVKADLTSVNDTYNLFGEIAPTAPYSAPSTGSTTVTNSDGTTSTVATDTTTLLGNQPVERKKETTTDSTSVSNRWNLKGAYFTFRTGPEISVPFKRFHASLSAGASLVYAGTTYSVTQTYQPATGAEVSSLLSDGTSRLLAGYYADATLQYDLTERTGFYVGAVYQANGSYEQTVANGDAKYATKVDLSALNGFRAGMTYRF